MRRFLIIAGAASALAIGLIILKGPPKPAVQVEALPQSSVTPLPVKRIESTPEDSKLNPVETFIDEGHQLPESLDVFIASHGKPLTENILDPVETAETPNDKEWAKAKFAGFWRTVTYSGMEASYYQFKDGGGHWTGVVISTPSIPVLWNLGVGSSTTNVVGRLGKPTGENPTALEYITTDDAGQEYGKVEFKHFGGKVTEVAWSRFLD